MYICFRFLDMMPTKVYFITYCFLIRIVSGLGAAATSTSAFTLLTRTFKDNLSPAMVMKFLIQITTFQNNVY